MLSINEKKLFEFLEEKVVELYKVGLFGVMYVVMMFVG